MNKALLAKQFWRICNNPNLLLTKTLKAKYSPNEDLHIHKPKKHSSWIWRSIMDPPTPILKQGVWKVGRGQGIPINHPNWFQIKPDAQRQLADQITRVADLIDQDSVTWKSNLIMQLYDRNNTNQILGLPLPKTQCQNTQDQIIWPHSESGEYQVK